MCGIWSIGTLASFLSLLATLKASQVCTSSQYKKISPSGVSSCIDCPKCPVAYGNLNKCGTTIAYNARIKCDHCSLGATFSTNYDYTQCLPCKVCAPDVISTPCTREKNTMCQESCKSKENYYDKRSRDCQKCSWCCYDGNDELQRECLNSGMPRNQSCSVRLGKKCGPISGKTTLVVSSFTTTINTSTTDKPAGNPDNTPPSLLIAFVVSGILLVFIGILLAVIIAKRCRGQHCQGQESTESESDESSKTSRRSSEEQPSEASSQDNQLFIPGFQPEWLQ